MTGISRHIRDPIAQAVLILVSCLMMQLLFLVIQVFRKGEDSSAWMITGAFTLFYAFVSAILMLRKEKHPGYFARSIYGFFIALIGCGLIGYVFSGYNLNWSASLKWIYFSITLAYLVFITIAQLVNKIIEYAQEEPKRDS